MKYLKYFETEAEYTAYKNGSDFITPNVSYTVDSIKTFYNPKETRLVCTYNVTDTTSSTKLCTNTSNFTSMEVDGVLLNSVTTGYTFNTLGEHTIKFELTDPTSIVNDAFRDCFNLTSITIPDSVTTIDVAAFYGCSGLTSLVIPDSVITIEDYTFYGCSNLTSVEIGSGVTYISGSAFSSCSNVKELYYNAPISLGPSLVQAGLTKIEKVVIGSSTPGIENRTFNSCTKLSSVTIGNSVTSIGDYAFQHCSNLTSVTIPDSVTSIGSYAFYYCSNLTSVTIPDSVTSIGDNTFQHCSNLTSVTIGNSVTSIGREAFYGCTSLSSITIPDSVTSIGVAAFYGCASLNEITCLATTAPSIQSATFVNMKSNGTLKVPAGSDYSSWISTDANYLGYYNWTIQYI